MGRVTISTDVDIDIEDYLGDVDLGVLIDECLSRKPKNKEEEEEKRTELINSIYFGTDELVQMLVYSKNLSLINAMKLEKFIQNL